MRANEETPVRQASAHDRGPRAECGERASFSRPSLLLRKGRRRGPRAYPHPLDARTGHLLAVVQLQALQAAAVLQVLQGRVGDEQAVVQLQHPQPLVAAGAVAQVQDAVVRDELAVGQTLERGESAGVGETLSPAPARGLEHRSWPERALAATACPQGETQSFGVLWPGGLPQLPGASHLPGRAKAEMRLPANQLQRTREDPSPVNTLTPGT